MDVFKRCPSDLSSFPHLTSFIVVVFVYAYAAPDMSDFYDVCLLDIAAMATCVVLSVQLSNEHSTASVQMLTALQMERDDLALKVKLVGISCLVFHP